METIPPCSLYKKLLGDSYKRRGLPPNKPQSLCMMLLDQSTHIVLMAKLENKKVRVMIDSGANQSYTSTQLRNKLA